MARKPKIGELRHRVSICTWRETPDDDVNLIRERPKVFEGWARISSIINISSRGGHGFDQSRATHDGKTTHLISIRNPSDVMITAKHWLFVERRFGRREWYRILAVVYFDDDRREDYLGLYCELDEVSDRRADPVTQTPPEDFEAPERDDAPVPAAKRQMWGGM